MDDHCSVSVAEGGEVTLISGAGQVFHNGSKLQAGDSEPLEHLDRVMMGQEMMVFKNPTKASEGDEDITAEGEPLPSRGQPHEI